ncbi:exodeoxyribonuclease V gamma subunit [Comamonas sp. BIGb0152]|uniref:exodeoxyribonuclease V subunit gamma n=1 Tax=Comamonas sp. BIGb0152 TaxID=2940601 RepID=UPI00216889E4|nr:exodeoxyribonuclease V subunit gamma [Comamonas sp. BIGb0152]MCS4292822.1 exodeoxyribonuclease V gamma subunit [Comamonas sp. BIGb0152]
MQSSPANAMTPGLMVIHSNHPEALRDLVVAWMQRYPLRPLESETILVQSNGIAQWLKLSMAQPVAEGGCGITAAVEVQLPAQFLWQAYRAVLGKSDVPEISPLDKQPLTWRLMRLLPQLLAQPAFAALQRFLDDDHDQRRRYQLAERIADLFDQYQVYRADWLQDWAQGRDLLRSARGDAQPLDEEQQWQAVLWRALLGDVGAAGMDTSRAAVHQRFVQFWQAPQARSPGLPRRVVVFGISSMPAQTLQALAAMSRSCQVLLCVHNPCRHHWSDIVADKDLLRHQYRRQQRKGSMQGLISDDDLHQHAHPLLAAWGKQGRDYIHLIDEFDQPDQYASLLSPVNGGRIDLFGEAKPAHMLAQLQDDILELRPLAESRALWPGVEPAHDHSIRFHSAHSPQREVEVLHDQLLARLGADASLRPRDIIVMVPDIQVYAPHIDAVFGRTARADPRFIPYTLADQSQRGREPMLVALEHVLAMPESRFAVSEVLDLLAVDAVRQRFGIDPDELALLHRWIEGAGVRWGLDAAQRARIGLAQAGETNSWRFGLRRMMLGFAVGRGEALDDIQPYDEIGGLDAAALGGLAALLRALEQACDLLAQDASPSDWVARAREVLALLFAPQQEHEKLLQMQLLQGLERWLGQCEAAAFDEALPLSVAREAWLAGMDASSLNQRFMAGAVSFCSLMPMRAIPFRVVCLLGMNDGAYPRPVSVLDFDLMRQQYRPGDRSRRDDDRYLLLEAVLSAREQLYISWVGRSIRDSTARPPSVLIGQLRDHLAQGWRLAGSDADAAAHANPAAGEALLRALTQEHPLQPFSPRYFAQGPAQRGSDGLYTYAQEWHGVHGEGMPGAVAQDALEALPPMALETALSLRQLQDFAQKPVAAFFRQRLQVFFQDEDLTGQDEEMFAPDGLQAWALQASLLEAMEPWVRNKPAEAADMHRLREQLQAVAQRLRLEGRLPLRAFADCALEPAQDAALRALQVYAAALRYWPLASSAALELRYADGEPGMAVSDWLRGLRWTDAANAPNAAKISLSPGRLHAGEQLRYDRLVRAWVEHLAWHNAGQPLTTVVCTESGIAVFAPLPAGDARAAWRQLLLLWQQGMRAPLPAAVRTSIASLEPKATAGQLAALYDDRYRGNGELQRSAELARTFPDFEQLLAAGLLEVAQQLYGDMLEHVQLVNGQHPQGLARFAHGDEEGQP